MKKYPEYTVNAGRDTLVELPCGLRINKGLTKEAAERLCSNPRAGLSDQQKKEIFDWSVYTNVPLGGVPRDSENTIKDKLIWCYAECVKNGAVGTAKRIELALTSLYGEDKKEAIK